MSAAAPPLALDVPPGWTAYGLADQASQERAVAAVRSAVSVLTGDEGRKLAVQLLAADADWLLMPDEAPDVMALLFVRPAAPERDPQAPGPGWDPVPAPVCATSASRTDGRWRRRRVLVDEQLILVDDLAVIRAPAADVVLAVCECTSTRSAQAAGDDAPARSAADELIDAMGVLG